LTEIVAANMKMLDSRGQSAEDDGHGPDGDYPASGGGYGMGGPMPDDDVPF
jgi:hypothetical protein